MTLGITALSIRGSNVRLSISDIQHKNAMLLCWMWHFIYYYAKCCYAECRYVERRSAIWTSLNSKILDL